MFVCVWDERKYYLTSLLLVGLMFVPFVLRFEGRRPQARELVLLATMTALAVAGRAAFYWLPQCKPVCAIVILTAGGLHAGGGLRHRRGGWPDLELLLRAGTVDAVADARFRARGLSRRRAVCRAEGAARAAAALRLFLGAHRSMACCSTRRACSCTTPCLRGSCGWRPARRGSCSTSFTRVQHGRVSAPAV
ncbi:MAG: hypothetical protein ACLUNO_14010 [Oscillospiraceae bacterium]